jgi:hypothetical protein
MLHHPLNEYHHTTFFRAAAVSSPQICSVSLSTGKAGESVLVVHGHYHDGFIPPPDALRAFGKRSVKQLAEFILCFCQTPIHVLLLII